MIQIWESTDDCSKVLDKSMEKDTLKIPIAALKLLVLLMIFFWMMYTTISCMLLLISYRQLFYSFPSHEP